MEIIGKDEADILAYAMRYAMPRYTSAPSTVAAKLANVYQQLSDTDLYLFIKDIEDGLYLAHPVHKVNDYARSEYIDLVGKLKAELHKRLGDDKFSEWMRDIARERSGFRLREDFTPRDIAEAVATLANNIKEAAREISCPGFDAEELARIVHVRVGNDIKKENANAAAD